MKRIICLILGMVLLLSSCGTRQELTITGGIPTKGKSRVKQLSEYSSPTVAQYLNEDGTQTIYLYAGPVKPDFMIGNPQDGNYVLSDAQVRTEIPQSLSADTPIRLGSSNGFLELSPLEGTAAGKKRTLANCFGQQRESICYDSPWDLASGYRVTPLEWGVNTEMTLSEKSGTTSFRQKLKIPSGWEADESSKQVLLFRDGQDSSRVQGLVYAPLAVDANGRWNDQTQVRLVESDPENGIYTVEYTVEEEFLQDHETRYPVILHQSAGLYIPKQADTTVSEKGEISYLSPYLMLGNSGGRGDQKALVRFDELDQMNIDPDSIQSVKYVFRNLFDLSREVKLSAYAVTENWSSTSADWENCPAYDKAPVGEVLVKRKGEYSLDVTALVREMMKNKQFDNTKYAVSKGFLLHCETPGAKVLLASGDNGLYSPCLELQLQKR